MNLNYIIMRARVGVWEIKHTYMYIIANLSYPISLLFIVAVLSGGKLLPYALAGGLMAILAMNGITMAAAIAPMKEDYKYKDLIVATKTSAMDFMIGEMVPQLIWSVPSIAVYLLLDIYFHLLTPFGLIMTLFIGLLVLLSASSIAFLITSYVKSTPNIYGMTIILSLIFITISPTFYPYTYLPHQVLQILEILPTTTASMLGQGIFGLAPMNFSALLLLVVETVVFFMLAKYFTVWREK